MQGAIPTRGRPANDAATAMQTVCARCAKFMPQLRRTQFVRWTTNAHARTPERLPAARPLATKTPRTGVRVYVWRAKYTHTPTPTPTHKRAAASRKGVGREGLYTLNIPCRTRLTRFRSVTMCVYVCLCVSVYVSASQQRRVSSTLGPNPNPLRPALLRACSVRHVYINNL